MKINTNKKLSLYSKMLRIRKVEERISYNYKDQEMRCPIHLSIGQEAIAVEICENLKNLNRYDKKMPSDQPNKYFMGPFNSLSKFY